MVQGVSSTSPVASSVKGYKQSDYGFALKDLYYPRDDRELSKIRLSKIKQFLSKLLIKQN